MAKIFFSYRRVDSSDATKKIYRQFERAFGVWRYVGVQRRNLFLDKDNILPKGDFRGQIQRFIIQSDHMLVIIGKDWLAEIQRRQANGDIDYVLIEIESAFIHKVNVIPVLVHGAIMPSRDQLPDELKQLATQHAHTIRDSQFDLDTAKLISFTKPALPFQMMSMVLLLVIIMGVGLFVQSAFLGTDNPQPTPVTEVAEVVEQASETPSPTQPTLTPSITPEIATLVFQLDSTATVEQATAYQQETLSARATEYAVGTQSRVDQTATATLWTDTPTPNITASIDAFRTQQSADITATQQAIDDTNATATQQIIDDANATGTQQAIDNVTATQQAIDNATATQQAIDNVNETATQRAINNANATATQQAIDNANATATQQAINDMNQTATEQAINEANETATQQAINNANATTTQQAINDANETATQQVIKDASSTATVDAFFQIAETGVNSNGEWEILVGENGYVREFDGVEMVLVPYGCFVIGSEDGDVDERNGNEVCVEPFWIDKYEVTNQQYGSINCGQISSEPQQPRACLDWYEAAIHCRARGGRLPTEVEWEFAARGEDELVYPWGNEFIADNVVYSENSSNMTAPVGSRSSGVSWVGALDMSGNLSEWTSSDYLSYPYTTDRGSDITSRVLRGGSIQNGTSDLRSANRISYPVRSTSVYHGFRCARDYEG